MGSGLRFKSRIFRICLYLKRTPAGGIRASQGTFSSFHRKAIYLLICLSTLEIDLNAMTNVVNHLQRKATLLTIFSFTLEEIKLIDVKPVIDHSDIKAILISISLSTLLMHHIAV